MKTAIVTLTLDSNLGYWRGSLAPTAGKSLSPIQCIFGGNTNMVFSGTPAIAVKAGFNKDVTNITFCFAMAGNTSADGAKWKAACRPMNFQVGMKAYNGSVLQDDAIDCPLIICIQNLAGFVGTQIQLVIAYFEF